MNTCQTKLIFLDIDGVVNTLQISDKPFEGNKGHIQKDGFYFDLCSPSDKRVSNLQAVLWLNKLCQETGAKIVISSTWRLNLEIAKESLYNSGLYKDIEIIGATPHIAFLRRGAEILKYLEDNAPDAKYVILDDDCDMEGCMDHLVQCDTYHGFGCMEYAKAKEILEK